MINRKLVSDMAVSNQVTGNNQRPLLPPWVSGLLIILVTVAVASLITSLVAQNRQLREALRDLSVSSTSGNDVRRPALGDQLPGLILIGADGSTRNLRQLTSGGGVVAFLTTTCQYCLATLPVWHEMATELDRRGLRFLAVSLHDDKLSQAYATNNNITFPLWSVVDSADRSTLPVNAVPVTAYVGKNGEIARVWRGQLRKEQVNEIVRDVTALNAELTSQ